MAEEFQGGVCGGNWWNSSRNLFGSSPCSSAINDIGSFGWPSCHELIMDMKTVRSSDGSTGSASDGSSIALQDLQKTQRQTANGSMSTDHSTLQMMGISLSSSPTADHWNQDLLHDRGRSEGNYSQILQEAAALNSSMNYRQQTGVDCPELNKDWDSKNFCQDFAINSFKQVNQDFLIEQQSLNSTTNSNECAATCQGLSANFPLNTASYSAYTSSLLQTLFDTDSQPQQSLLENQEMNYSSATSYQMNLNEFLPKASPNVVTKTSIAKQQAAANHLQFTNNTPFWNATAAALSNARPNFIPSTNSQFLPSTLNNTKNIGAKHHNEGGRDLASTGKKSSCNEPSFKRPRIETPSPLPTFKVRKEKLGDRITALQQLVSPFGKTDTASVLHEAIEYIKFLHDQVNVLSTPYLKNGSLPVMQHQPAGDNLKDQESLKQDLSSRGLCLVPISSTFPVAAETTSDFWTPTFGGSFR